jgi:small-conductance mechanosensitive channel/CRP-like cAMP-binding protein
MGPSRSLALDELITPDAVGVAVAVGLIVLMRALLPARVRSLARQPLAFLAIHLLSRGLLLLLAPASIPARVVSLVGAIFLFASIGRSAVLLTLDVLVEPRLERPMPRIFHDIIQGVVYVILLLVALRGAGVEPGSILTTSALITAAVALSLQETLGNLVAGLAIQAQRPFDVDDWIQFDDDPKHIGRVIEVNWRATKIHTLDDVEVIIPNATLAKASITTFTKPTTISRRSIYVHAPADVPPHVVHRAILDALPEAMGVLADPAPTVVTNGFVDGNVEYWVRFFTDQFHLRDRVDGAARDRVWYGLARARVAVAAPNRSVKLREVSHQTQASDDAMEDERRIQALGNVDVLRVLSDEQRQQLGKASRIRLYAGGEQIVKQGERSAEMFIVQSGEVVVQREGSNGNGPVDVARLGPGEFFGEMALMTGERRTATVRASSPCTLIGVDQHALKTVLETAPELAARISRAIAERQTAAETEKTTARADARRVEERSSQILGRIRKFFAL